MKPVLFACADVTLTDEEKAFFAAAQPFGFILFKRNCATRAQVRDLVASLRDCVARDAPIFIDQEGGRVARLGPPAWDSMPSMGALGALYARDADRARAAARAHALVTAWMLKDLGIDGNFAPVLDLRLPETSAVIGDRAFSSDPAIVADLGRLMVDTYLESGVLPVIKHMPGHGRVKVDPHQTLPFVDVDRATLESTDFMPFKALADAPVGMNCHVVFRALDPDNPASLSARVHQEIFRGALGFKGLIFSDDLAMGALTGTPAERAQRALAAGADLALYGPGALTGARALAEVSSMRDIVFALPDVPPLLQQRYLAARARLGKPVSNESCAHHLAQLRLLLADGDKG